MKFSDAFTMIELIFVIVILGILATVAIPKFGSVKIEADISKGRADVSAVRSGIVTERQSRLILGDPTFIAPGTSTTVRQLDSGGLFGGVLTYPITASNSSGHWHTRTTVDANTSTVNFKIDATDVLFTYTRGNGIFTCSKATASAQANTYCANLID